MKQWSFAIFIAVLVAENALALDLENFNELDPDKWEVEAGPPSRPYLTGDPKKDRQEIEDYHDDRRKYDEALSRYTTSQFDKIKKQQEQIIKLQEEQLERLRR